MANHNFKSNSLPHFNKTFSTSQIYVDYVEITEQEARQLLEHMSRRHCLTGRDICLLRELNGLDFFTADQIYRLHWSGKRKTMLRRLGILVNHFHILRRVNVSPVDGWPAENIAYGTGICGQILLGQKINPEPIAWQPDEVFKKLLISEFFVRLTETGKHDSGWRLASHNQPDLLLRLAGLGNMTNDDQEIVTAFLVEQSNESDRDQKLLTSPLQTQDWSIFQPTLPPFLVIIVSGASFNDLSSRIDTCCHRSMPSAILPIEALTAQHKPNILDQLLFLELHPTQKAAKLAELSGISSLTSHATYHSQAVFPIDETLRKFLFHPVRNFQKPTVAKSKVSLVKVKQK